MSDDTDRDASQSDSVPRPDPTRLTTQLVDRALAAYREVVEVRLNAMDQAVKLVAADLALARQQADADLVHFREDRDRQNLALREILSAAVANVSEVSGEKFNAVDTRFQERDTRTQLAADESRVSLKAALDAAKEAVSEQNKANTEAIRKSELATQKQIDSMVALMNSGFKGLEDKYSDLKSRIDLGTGRDTGSSDTRTEQRLNVGQVLLAASVLIAIAGLIIALVLKA